MNSNLNFNTLLNHPGSTRKIFKNNGGSYQTSTVTGSTRKSGGTDSAGNHYHTMADGTTGSANHLPPYLDMLFAEIDSDGYGEGDSIVLFSALPPLGWDRYTDLDDSFPRSASTAGGTGGSSSHSHSVTIETNSPSTLSSAAGGLVNTATDTHTHSCSTTTSNASNLPPYLDVIYGQRKDPAPSASIGSEEAVSSGSGGITYSYLYNGDGEMIAETIGLTTTIYIGKIYEKKDQGGTITEKKTYYAGSLRVAVSTKVGAGSWEVNFLLSDHLGSTSTTVDSSGGRIADLRYTPWGSTRYAWGTQITNYTYTGQRSVTYIKLIQMGSRYYDSTLGRFTQPDPIVPVIIQGTQAFDRFGFVNNNPIRFKDESGHWINGDMYDPSCVENAQEAGMMMRVLGVNAVSGWENLSGLILREDWGNYKPGSNPGRLPDTTRETLYDKKNNPDGYYEYPGNLADELDTVVIHHAGGEDNEGNTLQTIEDYHMVDLGRYDIAYHFIIDFDGTIYEGRDIGAKGAHVLDFNTGKIGVVFMGNLNIVQPTQEQLDAALGLLLYLDEVYGIDDVSGHNDYPDQLGTDCPGVYGEPVVDTLEGYIK